MDEEMQVNNNHDDEPKLQFKKIAKRKNFRRRSSKSPSPPAADEVNGDNLDDNSIRQKLESHKELQKLRQRPHGVNSVSLALGKRAAPEDEVLGMVDPFKSKTGGMIDMDALKSGKFQPNDDPYEVGIGTQFSAETNTRDEDAEMLKYIETELKKRKSANESMNGEHQAEIAKFLSPEEAALLAIPEYLRKSNSERSEEMLSNQMLSGIPEVDLGVEVKIKNIIATEDAKQKILRDRMNKKEGPSHFVPTNMAVNFVQHNRFNIEEPGGAHNRRRIKEPEKPKKVVVVGAEPELKGTAIEKEKGEKATDDFHFEKFKKQFRRF